MFYEITTQLYPQTSRIPYSIEEGIKSAIRYSYNHPDVQNSVDFLRNHFDTGHFSGDHLLSLWGEENVPMITKCLATFWWGNLSRGVATAYSPDNINRILAFSDNLLIDMEAVRNATTFDVAMDSLRELFHSFELGGAYKLNQVNVSFFTKLFEFYFASHPLVSNPDFLPIICDVWLRKGVYVEMTDRNEIDLRDMIFTSPSSLHQVQRSYAEGYIAFCIYFYQRVRTLIESFPNLSSFIMEGYVFSPTGRGYIQTHL